MINVQEYINQKYPAENRKNITKLEIDNRDLEGELDLSEFTNLSEILIINEKQRNWEGFYQWLNDNIVDINEKGERKGNIKVNKRSEYPTLTGTTYYWAIGSLMNSLENYLKKTPLAYTTRNYHNTQKEPVLAYDNNKNFFQLANGQGNGFKCGWDGFSLPDAQNALNEYERLLSNWRNSFTSKININIKLEQIQKITNLEKIISKLNLEIEEVSNELLEIKKKELEQLLSETKNKLDKGSWGYLDILLLCPDKSLISEKAKENLADKINNNDLQKLILLQHKVNHLEARINEVQHQQAQIEVLPPSYN